MLKEGGTGGDSGASELAAESLQLAPCAVEFRPQSFILGAVRSVERSILIRSQEYLTAFSLFLITALKKTETFPLLKLKKKTA